MQKNIARFKLPFMQGSLDGGFNANVMYDAEGSSVATLYGIPQSMTLGDLSKAVARGDFNNAWDEGAARAAFIVKACNSHDELKDVCGILAQIVYTQNGNLHADTNEILARAGSILTKLEAK